VDRYMVVAVEISSASLYESGVKSPPCLGNVCALVGTSGVKSPPCLGWVCTLLPSRGSGLKSPPCLWAAARRAGAPVCRCRLGERRSGQKEGKDGTYPRRGAVLMVSDGHLSRGQALSLWYRITNTDKNKGGPPLHRVALSFFSSRSIASLDGC